MKNKFLITVAFSAVIFCFFILISAEKIHCQIVDIPNCYDQEGYDCGEDWADSTSTINIPTFSPPYDSCTVTVHYKSRTCVIPGSPCIPPKNQITQIYIYEIDGPDSNCTYWNSYLWKGNPPQLDAQVLPEFYQVCYGSLLAWLFQRNHPYTKEENWCEPVSCQMPNCAPASYSYYIPYCMSQCYKPGDKEHGTDAVILMKACPNSPNSNCCKTIKKYCWCYVDGQWKLIVYMEINYVEGDCPSGNKPECPEGYTPYPECTIMCAPEY